MRSARLTPAGAGDASARLAQAMSLRARLADVGRFMVRPGFLAQPLAWRSGGAQALAAAGAVHMVLAVLVMAPLWLWGGDSGLLPSPVRQDTGVAASLFSFVVVAPLTEELLFRGWLGGRVAALRFAAYGALALGLMLAGVTIAPEWSRPLALAGAGVALVGVVHWGLTRQRDTRVPAWFIAHFTAIVWATTLAFGLVHLGNYTAIGHPVGVLVVLPQILGGVLLAYIRTRAGLTAAIGYHAAYNALFLGLSLAGPATP